MDLATNLTGDIAPRSSRGGWSDVEEARLVKIVLAHNVRSGRSTSEQWDRVADELARDGKALGFPQRSGSSCRHRAAKLGVYAHSENGTREAVTHVSLQSTFAAPEVKAEVRAQLAGALERIAEELRRA